MKPENRANQGLDWIHKKLLGKCLLSSLNQKCLLAACKSQFMYTSGFLNMRGYWCHCLLCGRHQSFGDVRASTRFVQAGIWGNWPGQSCFKEHLTDPHSFGTGTGLYMHLFFLGERSELTSMENRGCLILTGCRKPQVSSASPQKMPSCSTCLSICLSALP